MGSRYRSRSRSYSPIRSSRKRYTPSPPPRSKRYDDPRDMYRHRSARDRRSPVPSGLLVRNISLDARPEDLRIPFERFGYVKDVYLPKNYYTGYFFVLFLLILIELSLEFLIFSRIGLKITKIRN